MPTYKAHPITEVFPALSEEDFQNLKNDIEEYGQMEPIWLDKKGRIIDGRHRLRACRELEIDPEFVETEYEEADIPSLVISLNLRRRHLTESQKAVVAARFVPYFEKAAKARQKTGKKAEDGDLGSNLTQGTDVAGKSTDKAGRVIGVGGTSVRHALKVAEDGCAELKKALDAGAVSVSDAASAAKETKTIQKQLMRLVNSGKAKNLKAALRSIHKEAAIKEIEAMDPAKGGYPVLVADPPWPYEARKGDATQRGQTPYPQMSIDKICKMEVPSSFDSILFLWVTNSHLCNGNAARVCLAWGYQPKTIITWVKDRMGLGDWARSQTEHVVMAVRGKPKLKEVPVSYFEAPRGAHSEKPEEFYQLVERVTAGAKAELFARKKRDGWFCHGHGIDNTPEVPKVQVKTEAAPKGPPHAWGKLNSNEVAVCTRCGCEAKMLGEGAVPVRAGHYKGDDWEFCPAVPKVKAAVKAETPDKAPTKAKAKAPTKARPKRRPAKAKGSA